MKSASIVQKLRKHLPPVFPATDLTKLTSGTIRWTSLQNMRSLDKASGKSRFPDGTFNYAGNKKIIVDRDKLLDWWKSTINYKMVK